jgi:outer membrane lipoprotein carrier protein
MLPIPAILALLLFSLTAYAGNGEDVIARVQKNFDSVQGLSVHFDMRQQGDGSTVLAEEAGKLFLAEAGRFRMEARSQTVVGDGKTIWSYSPADSQVIIYDAAETQDQILTPRQILFEFPRRYRVQDFQSVAWEGRPADLLIMIPTDEADPTRQLLVWVDRQDGYPRRFQAEDLAGNVTVFDFENYQAGQKFPDDTFRFTPPPGVNVIDMR